MPSPIDALELPFMRTALVELVLLAVAGGVLGGWIVLRGLAFFAHAAGTATFPGLVAAHAVGVSPQLAGAASALAYAGGVERASRAGRAPAEATTGLLLAAALALGALLASDVVDPGATPERLLFGTLLGLSGADVALSAAVAALALGASAAAGRAWLALAFDPGASRRLGRRAAAADLALLGLVALAVAAALPAVGALLVSALFVVPAATARLVARSVGGLLAGGVAIALAHALAGLYLAWWLDVSPGPAVAVLAAGGFAAVAAGRALARARAAR
jgi:ABC-type Mn2+/Zn2+ transport system permease subunit